MNRAIVKKIVIYRYLPAKWKIRLSKLYASIRNVIYIFKDHHENKYISYGKAVKNIITHYRAPYETYNIRNLGKFKTSDTIFILGSGPSLNLLTEEQIRIINQHNSSGVNLSFAKKEIIPTFHLISRESPKQKVAQEFEKFYLLKNI